MDLDYGSLPLPEFKNEVDGEITSIKKILDVFPSTKQMLLNTWIFIAIAILLNITFLIIEPEYITYWVVSAFLIYMFNWLILMIPSSRSKPCGVLPMIKKSGKEESPASILSMIKEMKAKRASDKKSSKKTVTKKKIVSFGEIVWNIFFINSQPLAPMFIMVFAVNIFFSAYCLYAGVVLENITAMIVVFQAVAIIVYYAGIWHIKPYTSGFFTEIIDVRKDYQEKRIKDGIRSALFFTMLFGMFLAVGGTLVIFAMLMPGMTFSHIMQLEDCDINLLNMLKLLLILVSQIVLFRISQGIFSTRLLKSSFRDHLELLETKILPRIHLLKNRQSSSEDIELELLYLEKEHINTKIYKPTCHDLFGLLYVYIIAPDISIIINRFLKIQKRIEEIEENQFSVHSTTTP